MLFLGALLKSRKLKKSRSETTTGELSSSAPPAPPAHEKPEKPLTSHSPPPQLKLRRPNSMASSISVSLFKRKDRGDLESLREHDFLGYLNRPGSYDGNPMPALSRQGTQATSAANGLAALRINTPSSFRSLDPAIPPPPLPKDSPRQTVSPQSSSAGSSTSHTSSTPRPQSSPTQLAKPSFLTLPQSDTSFDGFNVTIDFTKFETTKVDAPVRPDPSPPRRITNHDFLFLIDDCPGLDHGEWEMICDIVHGVSRRLIPVLATVKDSSHTPELPTEAPSIAIRFVNHPRAVSRVTDLTQIRNIFGWVTPREISKHVSRTAKNPTHAGIPPLRTLEYHFWDIYNKKLQKNAWVGQTPSTIVLFTSSPLGNRPEDTDLFVAKCAETLNGDQVPLPLISIMIVQCNADAVLHRQLVDTRRMIVWEWYMPKGRGNPPSPTRKPPARGSTLNPHVQEQKTRPRRDWVDIVTCMDWERAGGIASIKDLVQDELLRGIHRRKRLQREVAMAYLTYLGKEDSSPPATTKFSSVATDVVNINPRSMYYGGRGGQQTWTPREDPYSASGGWVVARAVETSDVDYTPDFLQHAKLVAPVPAAIGVSPSSPGPPGRIDYYD